MLGFSDPDSESKGYATAGGDLFVLKMARAIEDRIHYDTTYEEEEEEEDE